MPVTLFFFEEGLYCYELPSEHCFCGVPQSLSGCVFIIICLQVFLFIYLFIYFCLFAISWPAPAAYGGSQPRGLIRAVVSGLHQSHSNAGSEPHLQPTPQLTAMPDR